MAVLLPLLLVLLTLAGAAPVAGADEAPDSLGLEATYQVNATIRWAARRLLVTSTATITNTTDAPVAALTFNLVPAKIGALILRDVRVGEEAATGRLDDQNVIVDLPAPLEPAASTGVTISYEATFARRPRGKRFLFMKRDGIISAYRWIPWLSRLYTFATPANHADTFVTQVAHVVDVTLTSDNPALRYATSGVRVDGDGVTEHFVAHDVRDFNFSASPRYQVFSETWNGVQLDYYTIALPRSQLVNLAHSAVDRYSTLVGPYAYPRLVIAETDSGEGMESPGLVWIPQTTSFGNRRYLVPHEIAHQWFYAVVGNNQPREPFADEAAAEVITRTLVGHRASMCAQAPLDLSAYEYSAGCYYETIYVQGDNYLSAYRQRVGDEAFWAGIRLYYERYAFKLGGTLELLSALDEMAPEGSGGGHEVRFPSLFAPD